VLRQEVKAAQTLVLREELRSRRRVLRRLGYLTPDGLVTPKGAQLSVLLRIPALQSAAAITCAQVVSRPSYHVPNWLCVLAKCTSTAACQLSQAS
jgi:hypothetical protein